MEAVIWTIVGLSGMAVAGHIVAMVVLWFWFVKDSDDE
jgi:hypothetical protein